MEYTIVRCAENYTLTLNADNVYYVRQSNLRGHVVRSAA
jgi:hypothetical protein